MLTHKDIDNTNKIETMRMALYNEEVLYEYETIEHQYLGYFAAAGFFSVMLWFLYDFSDDGIDAGEAIIFGGGGTIMTLFLIFFASADIKRIYKFTKNGILTEQADVVPEYALSMHTNDRSSGCCCMFDCSCFCWSHGVHWNRGQCVTLIQAS